MGWRPQLALLLALAGCGSVLHRVAPPPQAPRGEPTERVVPARARYHYLAARVAMEEEDWESAEASLRTALLHDPGSPWIWLALADVAAGDGEPEAERERAREAVRLGAEHPQTWARLGAADLRAGDSSAGIEALQQAVDLGADDDAWSLLCRTLVHQSAPDAPAMVRAWSLRSIDDHELLRERGRLRLAIGDLPGAVDDLGEATLRFPSDARLLDEYITAVTGSGLYRRGLAQLQLVHRLAPGNTDVLLRTYHLADAAHDPVRSKDALLALDAAIEGRDAHVKLWLADAWSTLGEHGEALAAVAAASKCEPPLTDTAFHRARLLRAAGRPAEALYALRIPETGSKRGEALALRVRLLVDLDRASEARREARAGLEQLPDDYSLLGALVAACAASGDREAMLAAIDRMAMLDDEARARTRARSLAGMGDVEGALIALQSARIDAAETWILGGTILREAGRPDEAVTWMQRAVDRLPEEASLRAELGVALDAAGERDDALISMREALGIDPTEGRAARYYAHAAVESGANAERLRQVRGWLLAALERSPSDATLLGALGRVELELSAPLRAVEVWEEALRYAPNDPALRRQLADAYRLVGRADRAAALERPR